MVDNTLCYFHILIWLERTMVFWHKLIVIGTAGLCYIGKVWSSHLVAAISAIFLRINKRQKCKKNGAAQF